MARVDTAGVTMLPQHIAWSSIEAGPDDSFAMGGLDTRKWDVAGTNFAADKIAKLLRYRSTTAHDGDALRARYTLEGALDTSLDAGLTATDGAQVTCAPSDSDIDGSNKTAWAALVAAAKSRGF